MTAARRALILVDHGSRQSEAHEHLEAIVRAVQSKAPTWFVLAAHMELAAPSLEEALTICAGRGHQEVWVFPMFVVPGRHLTHDIPALVDAAASRHSEMLVRLAPGLGMNPSLPGLILSTLEAEPETSFVA